MSDLVDYDISMYYQYLTAGSPFHFHVPSSLDDAALPRMSTSPGGTVGCIRVCVPQTSRKRAYRALNERYLQQCYFWDCVFCQHGTPLPITRSGCPKDVARKVTRFVEDMLHRQSMKTRVGEMTQDPTPPGPFSNARLLQDQEGAKIK